MPSIISFVSQPPATTTNSFSTIQPDLGTSPQASSPTDTLTLTSSDGSVTITGNSATDTINFQATTTPLTAQYVVLATDATLPNERVLTGTANQVIITDNGAGSTVVLSLPQSIASGSSPTFTGLTLSGLGLGVVHSSSGGVFSSSLIVNADVDAAAAIARSKLASGTASHVIINDGSGVLSSEATLAVSRGGTNIASYAIGDLIYATGATTLSKLVIGAAATILTSSGTAPQWQSLSSAGVAPNTEAYVTIGNTAGLTAERALTGTTNQVVVTDNGAGSTVVLSLPQSINTGASPTFTGLTLSGLGLGVVHSSSGGVLSSSTIVNADVSATAAIARTKLASGTADHVIINDGSGVLSSEATLATSRGGTNIASYTTGDLIYATSSSILSKLAIGASATILTSTGSAPQWQSLSSAGVAPNTVAFVTIGNTAALTAERALTGTSNQVIVTDNGANSTVVLSTPQDIATGSSPTFTGLTLSGLTAGSVIFAGTSGVISQDNTNFFYTDADDALGVGPSASTDSHTISAASIKHRLDVHANKAGTDLVDIAVWNGSTTAAQGPRIDLIRNKNTIASPTVIVSGDRLGIITAQGYDGTDYEMAAQIIFEVDGTPGSNDMPGRIRMLVTPDGSATPAEGFKLSNDKTITMAAYGTGIAHFSSAGLISSSTIVNADVSASAAIDFSKLAALTSANILVGNGSNVAASVAVTGDISITNAGVTAYAGTVPINRGGTNITTYTTGDLLYASATNVLSKRAIGSTGDVLTVSGGIPTWAAPAAASIAIGSTVTSGTAGSILFVNTGPVLAQDNANIFYDDTNNRMYLNTNAILVSTATATLTIVNPSNLFNQIVATSSDTLSPNIAWYRSRGSIASKTSVQSGDVLGQFVFRGYNSTDGDYSDGAAFQATVDGTPGSADIPTRMTFFTTPDGSSNPAEALRLSSDQSGRFSGKVTIGGTTAPDAQLDVMCASSSTKGEIIQGAASQSASLTEWQDSSANILSLVKANGDFQYLQSARTISGNTAFFDSSTATMTVSAAANLFMFRARNTFNLTAAHTIFNFNNFFLHNNTYKNDPSLTGNIASQFNCFVNQGIFQADTNATTACNIASCFLDIQTFNRINSGTLAITEWNSFTSAPVVGAGVTVTNRRGAWIKDVTNTGTVTTNTAVRIDAQASGGTNYTVDVAGKMQLDGNGLVIKYNNISTVSGGVPSELATADPTGQTAAIAATTLYTPTATGLFRISIYLQVTQAATTSSILGGATGVVITYNDGDGNVAQSNTAALATTAGAIAVTAAGNTTATNLEGTMVIYARTGVAIQYAIGYTSVGITVMKYAAHLKVEAF